MIGIKKPKKTLKQKIKSKFHDWCKDSTGHGISHSARSDNWVMRIVWVLFFIGCMGYCTYTIVRSITDYLKYETTISITRIEDLPATFPAVTICNINPFNEFWASEYINTTVKNYECFNSENSANFQNCLNSNDTNGAIDTFVDQAKRIIANDKNLTEDEHFLYGYDLNADMLISCKFNGLKCDDSDFTQYWDNIYGNCYTFNNGGKNKSLPIERTSESGNKYGLRMELVVSKCWGF
jgi:hypothetical protein